jgi:hypothetical protein
MAEMKDDEPGIDHLTPELFVDLLEGGPVAASRRQHLDRCAACREELAELSAALALVKSADPVDAVVPGPAAGSSRAASPSRLRRWIPWLSAAALLAMALLLARDSGRVVSREGDEGAIDALLPSVEQDADFQILRALSEELGEEALFDELYDAGPIPSDLSDLTPAERGNLLDRLAEDLKARS